MTSNINIERYSETYSAERLSSFAYSEYDTIQDIIANYSNNIRISQAIYPELCTLEVILRNSINSILKKYISQTWIEDEVSNNVLLDTSEYKTLVKAYNDTRNDCRAVSKDFTLARSLRTLISAFGQIFV